MVRVAFKDANERVRFFYIVEDGVPAGSIISFNEPIISFNMPTVAFNEPIFRSICRPSRLICRPSLRPYILFIRGKLSFSLILTEIYSILSILILRHTIHLVLTRDISSNAFIDSKINPIFNPSFHLKIRAK